MPVVDLQHGCLRAQLSTAGGLVLGLWWEDEGVAVPLLRPAPSSDADALSSACYPLVPFGNRIRDNRFRFEGRDHVLEPNTDWDRHYLHGEGWQAGWRITAQDSAGLAMVFSHTGGGTPYVYEAEQRFALAGGAFEMQLSVTNRGSAPLPYGLGWHPYFPLTPATTLMARATALWTEVEEWLPGEPIALPEELDFSAPRPIPDRWVNNGLQGWDGLAVITWPERNMQLRFEADPVFRHAFLFVSTTEFDPSFRRNYFCFEPMSHLANGHNLPDLGDLTILKPGETLAGSVRFRPQHLSGRPLQGGDHFRQSA
ncbi:aldose 1-epimerase [Labrys sp. LIt4]|uniref:aldose 1-epimerase n=1 Tax=Labrys sp. LIt4 TaxID=2821355 RepID=UPI001ADF78DD|nr:aldose 1-epimerase [Labrys sp. LIt4]MBP0583352.1 aldose 1-epimerase [Labrys sp. LIt4]